MIQRAQLKQEAKGILREARVSPYLFTRCAWLSPW